MNDWRALLHQFATGQISRRAFMAAAVATGASAGAIGKALAADVCGPCQAVEAAAQVQASPTAGGPLFPPDWVGPSISNPGPLTDEKKTLKICVPQHVEVGDWETNTFTQWYEARTNVHIEWQVVNGTEDERRAAVNAIIAGGDLPDIFMSAPFSPAQVQLFGQQGIFQPLNDIIDQNCQQLLGVFSTFPLYRDLVTTTDGNIYAMPNINDCYHCKGSSKLWMNKAWLDKLGLGIPQTTDEFRAALQAFKAQDPNGNGQADEVGLMSATDSWVGVTSVTGGTTNGSFDNFFMGSFMYNPGQPWLVLTDSKVDVTFNKDGWREGLKFLNTLVNDGTLAPESFSQLSEQLLRIGDNEGAEILGAAPGGYWGVFVTIDQTQAGARWEDYVAIPPLAGPDGTRVAGWNHYGGAEIATVTITNACEDPVLAAKWVDGLYELEATCRAYAGELGTDWRWAEEGELGINGKQGVWKQLVTWSSDAMRGHWWGQQNPNYRSSDFRLGEVVDPDAPTFESPLYQATLDNYFPHAEDQSLQMPLLYLTDEQATIVGEFAATVTGYVMQSMAEFITGAKDPNDDAAWSDYTSTLDSMGVADYLATYQQAYDAKYAAS